MSERRNYSTEDVKNERPQNSHPLDSPGALILVILALSFWSFRHTDHTRNRNCLQEEKTVIEWLGESDP